MEKMLNECALPDDLNVANNVCVEKKKQKQKTIQNRKALTLSQINDAFLYE